MGARFVAPSWLLLDAGDALEVRDLEGYAPSLHLSGELARGVSEGASEALLRLASIQPELAPFARDLAAAPPAPLTRAAVLEGGGYRQLFVELGARCNERCVHCYAESDPSRDEALTVDETLRVLDDARALGFRIVQLTGGDPLIAPAFLPAARHASALGFEMVEVYTNGLALRGPLLDELLPLRPSFAFSFYSHDPAIHDAITRTAGSQVRTARAIRAVVEAGLYVRVSIVALELNRRSLDRTFEYLLELGVPASAIRVDVERGVGRGTFAPGSLGWEMPIPGGGSHRAAEGERHRFGGTACVGYDGLVYPCIFSRHLPLGDLRRESLRDILEAPIPVRAPSPRDPAADPAAWSERLACGDCQVRSALLGSTREPLVQLRAAGAARGPG